MCKILIIPPRCGVSSLPGCPSLLNHSLFSSHSLHHSPVLAQSGAMIPLGVSPPRPPAPPDQPTVPLLQRNTTALSLCPSVLLFFLKPREENNCQCATKQVKEQRDQSICSYYKCPVKGFQDYCQHFYCTIYENCINII